jgi:hypothetical protein
VNVNAGYLELDIILEEIEMERGGAQRMRVITVEWESNGEGLMSNAGARQRRKPHATSVDQGATNETNTEYDCYLLLIVSQ